MTTKEYLDQATDKLEAKGIKTARLDSLILMEFVLAIDRAKILAEPNLNISSQQKNVLNTVLAKRAKHVPISHITHNVEFYGRQFFINKYVLEPRPESETMIDMLKKLVKPGVVKIADVGTGSGALGITAKLECKSVEVDLIDIDKQALRVAKRNVVLHTIDARLVEADLLPENTPDYDILLCNLPYVPDNFHINRAAGHEPALAIFGGGDGLNVYRKLFKILSQRQHKPLYILSEALPPTHSKLASVARQSGYKTVETDDFIQLFKLAV